MGSTENTPGFLQNSIRIHTVISRVNSVLRNLFLDRWYQYSSSEWNKSSAKIFIEGIGKKVYDKIQNIQKKSLLSGDVNKWDTTTITDILLFTEFPKQNLRPDKKERAMLEELKRLRNLHAHHPDPAVGIDDETFESMWERFTKVLTFFNCTIEELDKIKTSSNLSSFQDENNSTASENQTKDAERLKLEANELYRAEQYQEAVDTYTKALGLSGLKDSVQSVLYSNRSATYLSIGKKNDESSSSAEDFYRALQDGKDSVRLNPTWYKGYFRTANAYMKLKEYKNALGYFESALSLSPGNMELLNARDNCRLVIGQESRREYMDPTHMPCTDEELFRKAKIRNADVDAGRWEFFRKFESKLRPGLSFVREAQANISGLGRSKNPVLAAQLFAKAASLGNAEGMYNLGHCYKYGKGVQQDFKMAVKLFNQAASQPYMLHNGSMVNIGVAEAEHALGLTYQEGVGVTQDFSEAASWYQKASDHGFSGSSNNLAFLYLQGKGVPLSLDRAAQYWKLSASQGNALAMLSLAYHYLEVDPDPEQAREWQKRAAKHGNLDAQLNTVQFEAKVKEIEKKQKPLLDEILKWEKKTGNSPDGLTYNARAKRMLRDDQPKAAQAMDRLNKIYLDSEVNGSTPYSNTRHCLDPDMLAKYSELGSETAMTILTAMMHFVDVFTVFLNGNPRSCSEWIIREIAECYRIEQLVVQLHPDWKKILYEIVMETLAAVPENTTSDLDRDARIIYCYSDIDTMDSRLVFVEHSKAKYPMEETFYQIHSSICGFLRKYDLGMEELEKALVLFPNSFELLYARAVHMRLGKDGKNPGDHAEVIKAYEKFISTAPRDHRKIPESFYAIGLEYCLKLVVPKNGMENMNTRSMDAGLAKMEEYYRLGLDAEKIQLPCFMPYDSTSKELIESHLSLMQEIKQTGSKQKKIEGKGPALSPVPVSTSLGSEAKPNYEMLTDPNRLLIIKHYREHLLLRKTKLKEFESNAHQVSWTNKPAHVHRAPSQLVGLTPILFSEMDPCVDKVYKDRVVQVTSVEEPGIGGFPSISVIFQDSTGQLLRAFIYNYPEQDEKVIRDKLGFGAKMSIINPYMRLAGDGKFGLRIDDSSCIFHHANASETNKRCRFCGQENSSFNCGNCKWAHYCGKECQKIDWKLANHKSICVRN